MALATVRETFGLGKVNGLVGVEIELEGIGLPQEIPMWNSHVENSMRGENREYVTQGPYSLDKLSTSLNLMQRSFEDNKTLIKDAYRGSVHVHVNVQEKTMIQVFSTLFVWLMTEQLWMRMCGPTRDGNLFCMSSSIAGDIVPYADRMLGKLRGDHWGPFPNRGKYSSLNTDCLAQFGSLEFRTFPSSCDPKKVREWAEWSANLVEYGTSLDPDKLDKVWSEAVQDPRKFYSRIFGREAISHIDEGTLFHYAETGADVASDLILVWAGHRRKEAAKIGPFDNRPKGPVHEDWLNPPDLIFLDDEENEDDEEDELDNEPEEE